MPRTFLFLQGPHGPFFKGLGHRLLAAGHSVLRVNFNGGDWVDWSGPQTINFKGTQKDWLAFCENLYDEHAVTDLVVYGDCRSLHQFAIKIARLRKIRVHAFEEGYIRPDWITLEEDGVNGYSPMPSSPEWFITNGDKSIKDNSQPVGPSMRWLFYYCIRFYLAKALLSGVFSSYNRHRPYRVAQEFFLWVRKVVRLPVLRWRSNGRLKKLRESEKRYYLAALQLDSDAQLRVHSPYLTVAEFLTAVLKSFAENSPSTSLLVIKKHPLDFDAVSYETLSMLIAYSLGIRERVVFAHSGHLPTLIKGAEGVVVVNSTAGTSALHHGRPTIALGNAVYNVEGLTWSNGLDSFWTEGRRPDKALYKSFRACLLQRVLVNGGFYSHRGRKLAMEKTLARLTAVIDVKPEKVPASRLVKISSAGDSCGLNQVVAK